MSKTLKEICIDIDPTGMIWETVKIQDFILGNIIYFSLIGAMILGVLE